MAESFNNIYSSEFERKVPLILRVHLLLEQKFEREGVDINIPDA